MYYDISNIDLLRNYLGVLSCLCFHRKFSTIFWISVKKENGNLMWISMNLQTNLVTSQFLNCDDERSFCTIVPGVHVSVFYSFHCSSLSTLWLFLLRYCISFGGYGFVIFIPDFFIACLLFVYEKTICNYMLSLYAATLLKVLITSKSFWRSL
jgi:hypothetical protein